MTPDKNIIEWEYVDHHNDYSGTKMGMWFFLCTEVLLFSGLFLLYFVYFVLHREDFLYASNKLDMFFGTFNTVILLTSSLTMALSIALIRLNKKKLSIFCLITTIGVGILFLINKYIEWSVKIAHGIYPNSPVLSQEYSENHPGVILFYGLYYFMTGLHGFHVLVGIILLSIMLVFIIINRITPSKYIALELSGLYWHLVDLIWIYLFPLFYLLS
jgi:cytochrome c oxidase subunit 3